MKKLANVIIDSLGFEVGASESFDINEKLQFYVEVDGDTEGEFYHIEIIDIESCDILEASCCDIEVEKLSNEIERLLNNQTK